MWIIGDVHGCYNTLMQLISKLPKNAKLCFVGDLIDRGPDSAKVVEFVKSNGHGCVLGNHEQMMIDYTPSGPYTYDQPLWLRNGGDATLKSYGDDIDLYREHLEWIVTLPIIKEYKDLRIGDRHLAVSHSSAGRYLAGKADAEELMWNRDIQHGTLKSKNKVFNIFGHTVFKKPRITDYYAIIDTGAVYKTEKGFGNLTAIHFPSLEIVQQENIE